MSTPIETTGQNTNLDTNTATVVHGGKPGSFNGGSVNSSDGHVAGSSRPPTAPPNVESGSWLGRRWNAITNPSPPMRGFWKGLGAGLLVGVGATLAGVLSGATFGAFPLVGAAVTAAIVYGGGTATLGGIGGAIGYKLGKCRRKLPERDAEMQPAGRAPSVSAGSVENSREKERTPSVSARSVENSRENRTYRDRTPSLSVRTVDSDEPDEVDSPKGSDHSLQFEQPPQSSPNMANSQESDGKERKPSQSESRSQPQTPQKKSPEVTEPPSDSAPKKSDSAVTVDDDATPTNQKGARKSVENSAASGAEQDLQRILLGLELSRANRVRTRSEQPTGPDKLPQLNRLASENQIDPNRWARGKSLMARNRDASSMSKPGLIGGGADKDVAEDVRKAVDAAESGLKVGRQKQKPRPMDWETTASTLQKLATNCEQFGLRPSNKVLTDRATTVGPAARNFRMKWTKAKAGYKNQMFLSTSKALFNSIAKIGRREPCRDIAINSAVALKCLYLEKANDHDEEPLEASSLTNRLQEQVAQKSRKLTTCDPNILLQHGNDFYGNMLATAHLCHSLDKDDPFHAVATDQYAFHQALAHAACPNSAKVVKDRCQEIFDLAANATPEETGVPKRVLLYSTRKVLQETSELATYRPTIERLKSTGAALNANYGSGRKAARSVGLTSEQPSPDQLAASRPPVARSQGYQSSAAAAMLNETEESP